MVSAWTSTKRCWFECNVDRPLTNIGNARAPKWVCHPCCAAKRALDVSGRKDKNVKKELEDMKKLRQAEYKAKVRCAWIRDSLDPADAVGVADLASRTALLVQYMERISYTVSVKLQGSVKWCDEGEFLAH